MRKAMALVVLVAALGTAAAVLGTGRALAYGHADHPVAQVEISGNCDNPGFSFCSDVVGVGGVWAWAELDNVASTNSATLGWNEMDATIADCGHTRGGGGPGSAGGGGEPEFSSLGAAEIATGGAAAPIPCGAGGGRRLLRVGLRAGLLPGQRSGRLRCRRAGGAGSLLGASGACREPADTGRPVAR